MFSLKELNDKNQTYQHPVEVGRFSTDENQRFRHGNQEMSYFAPPKTKRKEWKRIVLDEPFDLNHGFPTQFVTRDPNQKGRLQTILNWILANRDKFSPSTNQMVTKRRCLDKLMRTNYDKGESWMLVAQKFKGVIYLNDVHAEKVRQSMSGEKRERMRYIGQKFEKYVTVPCNNTKMGIKERRERVVKTKEAYFSVISSRFGNNLPIIFGTQIDCVDKGKGFLGSPANHIELKTTKMLTCFKQEQSFLRYKLQKWWSEAYLSGTPAIVCGFRDEKGLVRSLEKFEVGELPSLAWQHLEGSPWSPAKCVRFTGNVLWEIAKAMKNVDEIDTCCVVSWELDFVEMKLEKNCENAFLPGWYVDEMSK